MLKSLLATILLFSCFRLALAEPGSQSTYEPPPLVQGAPITHGANHTKDHSTYTNNASTEPAPISMYKDKGNTSANEQPSTAKSEKPKDESSKTWTDGAIAYSAIASAFFTSVLTVSTIFLWRSTHNIASATTIAANAAKQSADLAGYLSGFEGPLLYPIVTSDTTSSDFKNFEMYDHPTSPVSDKYPSVTIKIKNFGKAPAFLQSVSIIAQHLSKLPDVLRVDFAANYFVDPIIDAGLESKRDFSARCVTPIDKTAFASIQTDHSHIFIYGEVNFADVMGAEFTQTFCLAYNYQARSFIPWGGKNNRRTRKNLQQ